MSPEAPDPLLEATMVFVGTMCEIHVFVATGFYNARASGEMIAKARETFTTAWKKAMQDGGP